MMRKVLLSIPPALSTLLFCAHLLYHGVPLAAAAAPLGALVLLAAKGAGAARLLALLHRNSRRKPPNLFGWRNAANLSLPIYLVVPDERRVSFQPLC